MKKIIGRIKLKNKVIVMDPCYDLNSDIGFGATLDDVKPGEYIVEVAQEGKTVISLEVTHVDYYKEGADPLVDMYDDGGYVGVDSGQAGIYNYNYFKKVSNPKINHSWYQEICKLTLSDDFGIKDGECVVSHSGYGDGEYDITIGYAGDRVVYISIDFSDFEEDEEDEDDYDWYDDEEEDEEDDYFDDEDEDEE